MMNEELTRFAGSPTVDEEIDVDIEIRLVQARFGEADQPDSVCRLSRRVVGGRRTANPGSKASS